jgi:hypothetical protein
MELTLLQTVVWSGLLKVHPDLLRLNLRIVDGDKGPLFHEVFDECNCRGLSGVARVGLKRESQHCDFL